MLLHGYAVVSHGFLRYPVISEEGSEILTGALYSAPFESSAQIGEVRVLHPKISPLSVVSTSVNAYRAIRDGFIVSILLDHLAMHRTAPDADTLGRMLEASASVSGTGIEDDLEKLFAIHLAPRIDGGFSGPLDETSYDTALDKNRNLLLPKLLEYQARTIRNLMKRICEGQKADFSFWLPRFRVFIPSPRLLADLTSAPINLDHASEIVAPHVPFLSEDILSAGTAGLVTILPPLDLWKGTIRNECISQTTEILLTFNPGLASNISRYKIERPKHWIKTSLIKEGAVSTKCAVFFSRKPCKSDGIKRIIGLFPEHYIVVFLRDFPESSTAFKIDQNTGPVIIRPPLTFVKIDTTPINPQQPK